MRFILRTLMAVVASLVYGVLALHGWGLCILWLAGLTYGNQVALDTLALAVPLATPYVGAFVFMLGVPPFFLACWGAAYPLWRRAGAALAGLGAGVCGLVTWQSLMTLTSGYAFSLRYAVADPVSGGDLLAIGLLGVFEAWVTLVCIPVRPQGRLRNWLRRADARVAV